MIVLLFEDTVLRCQKEKLLFRALKKNCHCETSAHTGRGNPPTIQGGLLGRLSFFVHFPAIRGIATPVCGLVRNDRKHEAETAKQQFTVLPHLNFRPNKENR